MSAARPFAIDADTVLDAQVSSLLQRVETHRDRRRREIEEESARERQQLRTDAWREAGVRNRAAVQEARARIATARQQVQASLDAASRRIAQEQARERLGELWRRLPGALTNRWRNETGRAQWIRSIIAIAARTLTGNAWTIEHAADASSAEIEAALAELGLDARIAARLEARSDLSAGLAVRADGACIDGTDHGLLADVSSIESAFLAECETTGGPDACGIFPGGGHE